MKSGVLLEKIVIETKRDMLGYPAGFKVEVDFLVNRCLEVLNSQLVGKYCQLDQRFRKVAIVLKRWSKETHESKFHRLNSFSIYMMLLAYMLQ